MLFDLGSISERVAERYDVITVGGGPSALAAAIYAKRMGLSILVIEKAIEGGQLNLTTTIDNYPGFSNIRGEELAAKMKDHARQLGAEFLNGVVTKIEKHDEYHTIMLQDGKPKETQCSWRKRIHSQRNFLLRHMRWLLFQRQTRHGDRRWRYGYERSIAPFKDRKVCYSGS